MKKVVMGLMALVILTVSASAQQKREMKGKHHMHQKMAMAQQLNFSEDQKKQAKLIKESFRKRMQELNKNEAITVKEFRDRKYAMHQEQKAKMQGLLTGEQKAKMEQMKADHKVKAQEHFAKRLEKMQTHLGLTDDQTSKMKTQREEMMMKMKSINEDTKMDRLAKKEKMAAIKSQMKEDHKKIFTADQLKKMEEMKKHKMDRKAAK